MEQISSLIKKLSTKQIFRFSTWSNYSSSKQTFAFSFKDADGREGHKQYCLPRVEIKYYNVMIDERNFFDQPIKTDLKPYDNIRKKATGQGHDYTTGCLLDYQYFKKHSKFIAIDLYKQKN